MKKAAALLGYLLYLMFVVEGLGAAYSLSGLSNTRHIPPYLLPKEQDLTPLSLWRTQGEAWGAWHKAGSQTRHMKSCFNAIYQANSHGARDKERKPASSGHPRYIVLGDSFVEGVGVNAEQRLTDLLEARTGKEFLNFGAVDFGPLQYETLYQNLASRFEHDGVLILLLPDNDFTDNDARIWSGSRRYRPVYGPDGSAVYPPRIDQPQAQKGEFSRSLWTYFWTYGAVTDLRHALAARKLRPQQEQNQYSGYRDATPAQIGNVLGSLERIRRLAQDKPLYVATIPRPNDIAAHAKNPALPVTEALRRFGKEKGVHVVDLLPAIAAAPDQASLYLPCDGHWSEQGNRLAADTLYETWFKPR